MNRDRYFKLLSNLKFVVKDEYDHAPELLTDYGKSTTFGKCSQNVHMS